MNQAGTQGFVVEPERQRPVLYDVDVAVAGAGLCSSFAAIAAARLGAKTLVIDRYGVLGGNIGPGMIINGSLFREAKGTLPTGLAGIAKEFSEKLTSLQSGSPGRFPEEASLASSLLYEMMKAEGVEFLLGAYASDPIIEGNTVRGLFVECASGRVAVRARVTIDGTGIAEVAQRAGAPMRPYFEWDPKYDGMIRRLHDVEWEIKEDGMVRRSYYPAEYPNYYNDTQILFLIADVDLDRFKAFAAAEAPLGEADKQWAAKEANGYPTGLVPALREASARGEFRPRWELSAQVTISAWPQFLNFGPGIVGFWASCSGAVNASDSQQMSRIEGEMRDQAFRLLLFLRKNAPGVEKAYIAASSAFFGWRGGPHIEGEHTLTPEESFDTLRVDDVLYRNIHEGGHGGDPSGYDVPYGIVLPKGLDGLLVCGRGAAYLRRGHEPTGMRARPSMMVFGQTVGTAAAIAALDGVTPKKVDIKKVQRQLVADGIYLGDEKRLAELGLK